MYAGENHLKHRVSILSYPNIQSYACAFSSVSASEAAMVRALFGEIPIHGKLPVTLPNVAKRGDGMDMSLSAASICRVNAIETIDVRY
jgi:hypothetical protein